MSIRLPRFFPRSSAYVLVIAALFACGAATGPDFGPVSCPASAPDVGALCAGTLECEYGKAPDVACDTVFECGGGQWGKASVERPWCMAIPGAPDCPATYAALQAQTTCRPTYGCYYPEANCNCGTRCGSVEKDAPFWCCPDGPSGAAGCPTVRPRIGTSCVTPRAICDYGGCSGNVTLECTSGTWQPTADGGLEGCAG